MRLRRLAALAALGGTVVLAGGVDFDPARVANNGAPIVASLAPSAIPVSAPIDVPRAAMDEGAAAAADGAIVEAALPAATPMPPPETPSIEVASLGMPDPAPRTAIGGANAFDDADECFVAEICIDRYLWSIYQRTPKLDTIRVPEQIKVTVKKKGKTRTVVKTVFKLVDEDFTWKDPAAAQKAGMPLMDYVIGGMDTSFKLKLYHALRAMDDAGLVPGITSAFRDDYRQALASGKKAATDSSYHGGSRRGGYGHGLAADLVSVNGETRAQRWIASEALWKWVDAHGKEYGVGRPYLDRDPPHVGPIDGKEYVEKRGLNKLAALDPTKRHAPPAADDRRKTKSARTAAPKARNI